jgi:hypothetical protein
MGSWIKANPIPFDSTHYVVSGLNNGQDYYFKINAVNRKEYESDSSSFVSSRPIGFPMDRGLVVVDETMDGNGSSPILPTDEMVDSFYAYCIAPIMYTQWDCAEKGLPPLDTLAHYSQVLWHDDDMGFSTIDQVSGALIAYCYNGGGFVMSGWRTIKSFTPSMLAHYGITGESEIPTPRYEGIYGMNGYPDVAIDTTKMIGSWNGMLNYGWYFDITSGDTIGIISSPDTLYDSLVTAVRTIGGSQSFIVLGFPLYFTEGADARVFLQKALEDVGAGVSEIEKETIKRISIGKPYPEPFSARTHFSICLPHSTTVDITVFDVSGRMVKTIYSGKLAQGRHAFTWNGKNNIGKPVASSIYFIRIEADKTLITRKVIFVR